jgi:hypothetical protein
MASAWVYEHAWGKPKEYDPSEEKPDGPVFDPRAYTPEQLDIIEAALRLMPNRRSASLTSPRSSGPVRALDLGLQLADRLSGTFDAWIARMPA